MTSPTAFKTVILLGLEEGEEKWLGDMTGLGDKSLKASNNRGIKTRLNKSSFFLVAISVL